MELKEHWEKVYAEKSDLEVSWYQESPAISLELIKEAGLGKSASIIDIGGGNSNLTGALHKDGYSDLTVLDISANSIGRMQQKLGSTAKKIHWIESNILQFTPIRKYQLWHDRATFHFLTSDEEHKTYRSRLEDALEENGIFILATFSTEGPKKCSGLDICQYDCNRLNQLFCKSFELLNVVQDDHQTPFNTSQNFIYSMWKKRR